MDSGYTETSVNSTTCISHNPIAQLNRTSILNDTVPIQAADGTTTSKGRPKTIQNMASSYQSLINLIIHVALDHHDLKTVTSTTTN